MQISIIESMGMPKSQIRFRDNPLKYMCNEAYYMVRDRLPGWVEDRTLAFGLGFTAGYGAGCVGEYIVHPQIVEPLTKISLEDSVKAGLVATTTTAVVPKVLAPEAVKFWRKKNPLYSSGILGVLAGASAKALVELL